MFKNYTSINFIGYIFIPLLFVICVFFRGLHLSTTKIQAMDVLLELSMYCSAETVLDRIVPYIVSQIVIFKYFTKCIFLINISLLLKFVSSFYSGITINYEYYRLLAH